MSCPCTGTCITQKTQGITPVRAAVTTDAQRDAGAEVVVTGRAQPYAESTVRKRLRVLARQGGTSVAARAVQKQVHHAVATADSTERIAVYTDMYDQVCWTKKPAHAGPVGNRGNRIRSEEHTSE